MKRRRNRHTGRINAAKRRILQSEKRVEDSRGRIYAVMHTGIVRPPEPAAGMPMQGHPVLKMTLVRDFDAERARAATA